MKQFFLRFPWASSWLFTWKTERKIIATYMHVVTMVVLSKAHLHDKLDEICTLMKKGVSKKEASVQRSLVMFLSRLGYLIILVSANTPVPNIM